MNRKQRHLIEHRFKSGKAFCVIALIVSAIVFLLIGQSVIVAGANFPSFVKLLSVSAFVALFCFWLITITDGNNVESVASWLVNMSFGLLVSFAPVVILCLVICSFEYRFVPVAFLGLLYPVLALCCFPDMFKTTLVYYARLEADEADREIRPVRDFTPASAHVSVFDWKKLFSALSRKNK